MFLHTYNIGKYCRRKTTDTKFRFSHQTDFMTFSAIMYNKLIFLKVLLFDLF